MRLKSIFLTLVATLFASSVLAQTVSAPNPNAPATTYQRKLDDDAPPRAAIDAALATANGWLKATPGSPISSFQRIPFTDIINSPYIIPQETKPNAGDGTDDYAALQAALNKAAVKGGVVFLPEPPSGAYNVCAGTLYLSGALQGGVTIRSTTSGSLPIRLLPGCASPPPSLFYVNVYDADPVKSKTTGRVSLENIRIDGRGLVKYPVYIDFAVAMTITNSTIRNAAPGGADVFNRTGYETVIDEKTILENVNDQDNQVYGAYVAGSTANIVNFPACNLMTYATDGHYSAVGKGAAIANYCAMSGGANQFNGTHGWGYPATNADNQPYSRPMWTYLFLGTQIATHIVGDQPVLALVRSQRLTGASGVMSVTMANAGSGGTPGIVTLTGTTGTGTKFVARGYVRADGTLSGNNLVVTEAGNYSVNPTLTGEAVTATGGLTGVTLNVTMSTTWTDNGGVVMNASHMTGPVEASVSGVSFGAGVNHPVVQGNNFSQLVSPQNCIVADSGIPATGEYDNNTACTLTGFKAFSSPGASAFETVVSLTNPTTQPWATTALDLSAGPRLRSRILGQQVGSGLGAVFGVQVEDENGVLQERVRVNQFGDTAIGTTSAFAKLTVNGPIATTAPRPITATTATVAATDASLILRPTATMTLTLPSPASSTGRFLFIKNESVFAVNSATTNFIPLAGGSAGTAIFSSGSPAKWKIVQSDGTAWVEMLGN